MHRFYCPQLDCHSKQITLTDQTEIHHLKNVLRLKNGDEITVFNGKGREATGKIISVGPAAVDIAILEIKTISHQGPTIILACAIPKKGKFEWIIEKATELGASEIIPLQTKRTEIKLKGDQLVQKTKRYQTVAINAAKQSRRNTVPQIQRITDFSTALRDLTTRSTVLIPSLQEKTIPLLQALAKIKSPQSLAILIGPEGDFTPEEYAEARKAGCLPVSLGPTTLKVETAAIAVVAYVLLFFLHTPATQS